MSPSTGPRGERGAPVSPYAEDDRFWYECADGNYQRFDQIWHEGYRAALAATGDPLPADLTGDRLREIEEHLFVSASHADQPEDLRRARRQLRAWADHLDGRGDRPAEPEPALLPQPGQATMVIRWEGDPAARQAIHALEGEVLYGEPGPEPGSET